MDKATYTKGRWSWWTSNSWRRLCSDQGRGVTVSVLEPTTNPRDGHPDLIASDGDMALISAAPDLVEALHQLMRVLNLDTDKDAAAVAELLGIENQGGFCELAEKARAALSKALGEGMEDNG